MIKGTGSGKLLKLLSFILLIGFSILFANFSSAVDFTSAGNNTYWSGDINTEYLHGGYTYNVSNNLNFNTSISLLEGNLFYLEYISYIPASFSLSWANNELYFTSRRNQLNIQGTLNNWYVGPVSDRTNDSWYLHGKTFDIPTSAIIQAKPDFKEYFFGVIGSTNDWVENIQAYYICFSDYVNDYCVACNISSCPSGINTGNSLGISDFSFDSLSAINWDNSPFVSSSGGGSINVNINNNITGDYVSSNCTYKQIFEYAESNGYSEYLCYGGLDNFDLYSSTGSYNPIAGTGKTLGQILGYSNAWDTPQEWFTFWNGLYLDRYNHTYDAMWESYPAVYRTWFDLYYRYGGQLLVFDSVREYCSMKMLDIDFNTTYYKGQYFKNTCDYIKNNGQYPYGDNSGSGDSDNVVGVNWIGVGNMGSGVDSVNISDNPAVFIQNFFNELKANLPTRYDLGGGFLPVYIITFMLAIILFRFLSH